MLQSSTPRATYSIRKDFQFPSSQARVEIIAYKNPDGSFRNADALISSLEHDLNDLNNYLLYSRRMQKDVTV